MAKTTKKLERLTHAARVLHIREMLDCQSSVSIAELMETFRVARRTVYNDLHALEDAGVPIYADPARDGRWTMTYTAKRQTLTLTVAQILSLGVARQVLSFLEGTYLHGELDTVIARMSAGLKPEHARFLDELRRKIAIVHLGAKRYTDKEDVLNELVSCLLYNDDARSGCAASVSTTPRTSTRRTSSTNPSASPWTRASPTTSSCCSIPTRPPTSRSGPGTEPAL